MMIGQPEVSASPAELLRRLVRKAVLKLLSDFTQPSAWELVEQIEHQVGPNARGEIEPVLEALVNDPKPTQLHINYLLSLLETGDLARALNGEKPPRKQIESTVDTLIKAG